jgi:hypothetical protein
MLPEKGELHAMRQGAAMQTHPTSMTSGEPRSFLQLSRHLPAGPTSSSSSKNCRRPGVGRLVS